MWKCLLTVLLTSDLMFLIQSARILAYIPTPSYSHQGVYRPLWRELSLRGHQVTLLTTDPINDPYLTNLTEIDLSFMYNSLDSYISEIIEDDIISSYLHYINLFTFSVDTELQHPSVMNLFTDTSKSYDLFIGESYISAHFALAEKFQCPFIGVSSLCGLDSLLENMGVPTHPVLYPEFLVQYNNINTFKERLTSVLFSLAVRFLNVIYITPYQDYVIRKHFGQNFPSSNEIMSKISLLFENSSPVFDKPRSKVPAVVSVSGIHKVPSKPLPQELKKVLDSATEGFIYFSLGSHVKSSNTSDSLQKILLETFAELPYLIIWKFEDNYLPNKPKNVFISKWLPQADVLRHHNIKLFITHCGYQSIEESLTANVPMVGIPIMADQPRNAQRIVEKGLGLSLNYKSLNKNQFKETIMEVATNSKYRRAGKHFFELIEDQPMSGLDRAVWWVEYVIRHKGAIHLRSPVLDIPWYQYYLLDVITVIVVMLGVLIYTFILTIHLLRRIVAKFSVNKTAKRDK